MSDSERKLGIKITSTADTTGAKQMNKELGNLNDWAKQTGYQMPQAADAVEKVGKKAKDAAKEGLEKFELSGREARLMINQLGPGVEGLGHLFTSLSNPIAATGFGLIVAKGVLDEYNKKLDETAERNAAASESFKAMHESAVASRQALAEFNHEMAKAADETERANTAFEARLKLLNAENAAGKQHGEDMGETPLQQAYRDKADRDSAISARNTNLGLAQERQARLVADANALSEKAEKEETERKIHAQKLIEDASKEKPRLLKEMNDASKEADSYQNVGPLSMDYEDAQKARAEAERTRLAYEQNEKAIKRAQENADRPSTLRKEAEEKRSEAGKNKAFMEKEGPAIQSDIDINEIDFKKNKRHALDQTDIGGGLTGTNVEEAARVVQLLAEHKTLTATQMETIKHFQEIIGMNQQQMSLMLQLAGKAEDSVRISHGLLTKVQILENLVAQFKNRNNSGQSGITNAP